jgi:hypothetical protein
VTWTLRVPEVSRLGVWLLSLSLLAACASVLGIEERKADNANNYPLEGYPGCVPGNCGGCLDVHQAACQVRTSCAADHDDCSGCVCQNCLQPVVACQGDPGCSAIWQCLRETRCDLSAGGNCVERCGSVVQANGGFNGAALRAAAEIRTCAASAACLSCLTPQVQQSARTCSQATACQDCPDCFDQCLCSGEKFGDCQRLCGEQAPPAACTDADSCAGCSNCFDACACGGGSYDHCISACTTTTGPDPVPEPPPPGACSAANSCVGCADCTTQCVCSGGGNEPECQALCAPQSQGDSCVEDPRGVGFACGGCKSCVAQCTCGGKPIEDCLATDCPPPPDCENNPGAYGCGCPASSVECFEGYNGSCDNYDSYDTCLSCACHQCPGELGMCLDAGCQQTFDCMRATGCQGSACLERCGGSDSSAPAFAYAEALWACYQGSTCQNCAPTTLTPVTQCPTSQGSVECKGFVGINVNLPPCCSSTILVPTELPAGGATPTTPDDNPCGLDISAVSRQGRACEPRAQQNPPRYKLLETCPSRSIAPPPYNGALLQGCCRGADHSCGYFDDITGLGCLSTGIFGDSVRPCPDNLSQ